MLASFICIEIREIFQQIDQSPTGFRERQGSFATPFRIMLGRDITRRAKRNAAHSSRHLRSRDLCATSIIVRDRGPGILCRLAYHPSPSIAFFGKTHDYKDRSKLLRRKNKACLTTLVVWVVVSQQQTHNAARSFRITWRACLLLNWSRPFQ